MLIINTGRYDLQFNLDNASYKFYKRRIYEDTGNVAFDGITEVSDKDFAELKKQKLFKDCLDKKTLSVYEVARVKKEEVSKKKKTAEKTQETVEGNAE